jgi:hypothetical protein
MPIATKHFYVARKRPSKVQAAVVEYAISDSGVASVDASQVLKVPDVQTQLAAVKKLRLAGGGSHNRK